RNVHDNSKLPGNRATTSCIRFSFGCDRWPFQLSAHAPLQILLRRARRSVIPNNLRGARILHYADRDRHFGSTSRRNRDSTRTTDRTHWPRYWSWDQNADSYRSTRETRRLYPGRYFGEATAPISGCFPRNFSGPRDTSGSGRLLAACRPPLTAPESRAQRRLFS